MKNILSKNGLTSSEANHITNVTKELVKDLEIGKFPLSTASVVQDNGKELPLDENVKNENWIVDIQRAGELFALSAWLKTAIKYKENLLDTIDRARFIPEVEEPELEKAPSTPKTDFEDYLNQLNTKDRAEYLSAEAKAAHIGKFIHNFDAIRQASENFSPTSFMRLNGSGETVTVVAERLYSKQELSDGFFTLQKEHRAAEQVVNLYKSRHKEWQKETLQDHNSELKSIASRNVDKQLAYNKEVDAARLDFENSGKEQKKEISALKIIVPESLQDTLDFVNQYAKK